MFVHRFSKSFSDQFERSVGPASQATPPLPQIMPLVSPQDIYQAAAARAYHEHQLDKLFNAEYYGDHGSGI